MCITVFHQFPINPMPHLLMKIRSVTVPSLYNIHLVFEHNTEPTIDFEPLLHGPMYGPLKEPSLFGTVKADSETGTIAWPNGADFDPATPYKWDTHRSELAERALPLTKKRLVRDVT